MTVEKDYVLGTHDDEIERLGLQHRVWRPKVTDAWQRAGFTVGQTLLDVGCGPGALTPEQADAARRAVSAAEAMPGSLMITPGVIEIVATKR